MAAQCEQCGAILADQARECAGCGALIAPPSLTNIDPQETRIRELLAQARVSQQEADITTALRLAREALSLRPECSTIHALLGHLHEQNGNASAARYHFQAALSVTPHDETTCVDTMPFPEITLPRVPMSGWVTLVLIGCILLSGLAVFITMMPQTKNHGRASVLQTPLNRDPLPTPNWTYQVPGQPVEPIVKAPVSPDVPPPTPDPQPPKKEGDNDQPDKTVINTPPKPDEAPPVPPTVLGPSSRPRVAGATKHTLEAADQAYFRGEYELAVTIYEEQLAQNADSSPRLYQDLAWCYQHLGNSKKADEQLTKAVTGYQTLLDKEPENAAAKQGLQSCQAARNALALHTAELPK